MRRTIVFVVAASLSVLALRARADDEPTAHVPATATATAPAGPTAQPEKGADDRTAPAGVLNAGEVRRVSLLDVVRLALQANLSLRAGRIDPAIADAGYQAERALFDPLLSAEFGYAHSETPSVSAFFGRSVVTENDVNGTAGVTQLLPSGGTVSFMYRADRDQSDSLFVTVNPAWTHEVGFETTQPLLRGAGDVVLSKARTAHNDVIRAREGVRALREDTILQVVQAYWELARLQDDLGSRFKSEETAAKLLRDANARLDAKVGTPLQVAEARAGLEDRRGTRITTEGLLAHQQDVLRALVEPFTPTDAKGIRFVAADDVNVATTNTPEVDAIDRYVAVAMQNRPELKATHAELANRSIDVTVAADSVRPQLDLVGGVGSSSLKSGFADSVGEMFKGQALSANLGIRFSMFIGQRAARSRLRASQWARRQAVLRFQEQQNQVVQQVRDGVRQLVTARAVLESADAQVDAAEEDLRGEQQLLAQGKSTPFNTLQKEEALTNARLRRSTAATEVRKAEARFWRSVGLLGENLGVGPH